MTVLIFFVKSMTSCLSELKVTPSFCFPNKIRDDPTATNQYSNALWDQNFLSLMRTRAATVDFLQTRPPQRRPHHQRVNTAAAVFYFPKSRQDQGLTNIPLMAALSTMKHFLHSHLYTLWTQNFLRVIHTVKRFCTRHV